MEQVETVRNLKPTKAPVGRITRYWVDIVGNGIGQSIKVPAMVARGANPGPVLGVTAVVHGNELNGLPVIQRLFRELDVEQLCGTVVGIPVVNVPSVLNHERRFIDGEDLNRIFPGRPDGDESEVYSHRIMRSIVRHFEYMIDLHTASFGRINSYYIRADLSNPITERMALLQNAEIVLDVRGEEGTLRSAARDLGIHPITVEVGDPNLFQKGMIRSGLTGIYNVLCDLKMLPGEIEPLDRKGIVCDSSRWLYADRGGILQVLPKLATYVEAGEHIATIRDAFGDIIKEYYSPADGIVIGKSTHPVNQTGGRILHLGKLAE